MPLIESDTRDSVCTITLNRPDCLNAMTVEMFQDLATTLHHAASDPDVRCVLLTGSGRAFCAGGDVRDLGDALELGTDPDAAVATLRELMESSRLLAEMPKPTVAAINGPAAGAGLSLAMACDLRWASDQAVLTTAFGHMGVSGDFGINFFLTHAVGAARARELMMRSPRLSAQAALDAGLIHGVVADEVLVSEVRRRADELAAGPTRAFALMKQNIARAQGSESLSRALDGEAAHMVASMDTEDHREAARAFLEKRPPRFRGR